MRIAAELSTRPLPNPRGDAARFSELLRDGVPTGRRVAGATLEAAVACGDLYLLFLTDDVPFEEMLSIHLLDEHLDLVDSATMGGPYATGAFSDLRLIEPNRALFRFLGPDDWSVEILTRPGWRIPLFGDPAGVWRRPGFRRRLVVRDHRRG